MVNVAALSKVLKLLDILPECGSQAFASFCEIVRPHQPELATELAQKGGLTNFNDQPRPS